MAVRFTVGRGIAVLVRACVAMLALPAMLAAQSGTVTGKVTDRQTGEPLASARVYVAGGLTVAVSRGDGTYRLAVSAGSHDLRVSAIGYTTGRATTTSRSTALPWRSRRSRLPARAGPSGRRWISRSRSTS